jgi:hypothetical protein
VLSIPSQATGDKVDNHLLLKQAVTEEINQSDKVEISFKHCVEDNRQQAS